MTVIIAALLIFAAVVAPAAEKQPEDDWQAKIKKEFESVVSTKICRLVNDMMFMDDLGFSDEQEREIREECGMRYENGRDSGRKMVELSKISREMLNQYRIDTESLLDLAEQRSDIYEEVVQAQVAFELRMREILSYEQWKKTENYAAPGVGGK